MAPEWADTQLVTDVVERLSGKGPRYTARASGRLDVMGGSAGYSGSLVLNTVVPEYVCVAAQRRDDGQVSIEIAPSPISKLQEPVVFEQGRLLNGRKRGLSPDEGRELLDGANEGLVHRVVAALVGLVSSGAVPDLGGGLSIVVGTTMDDFGDLGQEAALGAAVLVAAARAMDVELNPKGVGTILEGVEPGWFPIPVLAADVLGILSGEPSSLTQVQGEPCKLVGSLSLPDNLAFVGVDCGVTDPEVETKYEHVRTAAFMGRTLIDRILRHEGLHHLQWDGRLSQVSVTDYVERFRDRIPTKIRGSDFLDRFGETGDPATQVDPSVIYKVRSRTEHQIYEHDRANQFVERLSRAIRNSDTEALRGVGELMHASHWSYGQRCGLGSVQTDLLVSLFRQHGSDADIFGAKITGRGCGGIVAVFMRATDRADAALESVVQDYKAHTGLTARLIRGA
jgi:L-arabinokinase